MNYSDAYSQATHAFAEPGKTSIVDVINPSTDRSWINGETLEEIRLRYPTAERVSLADWTAARAAAQDAPIVWEPSTREQYHEMLEVLPPAAWIGGYFLVGEPMDHHATSGRPRFTGYRHIGDRYEVASRPLTIPELRAFATGARS